jgi:hypothetical protein
MKRFAVFVVVLVCSGAFASEPKPEVVNPTLRASQDSDLIVKDWHSPITFEVDASWLADLAVGQSKEVQGIPTFHCDGATLDSMTVKKTRPHPGVTRLKLEFDLSVEDLTHDKLVDLEFTLLSGNTRLPLGREKNFAVAEGKSRSTWVWYEKPDDRLAPYMTEGSNAQLRISMIVRND